MTAVVVALVAVALGLCGRFCWSLLASERARARARKAAMALASTRTRDWDRAYLHPRDEVTVFYLTWRTAQAFGLSPLLFGEGTEAQVRFAFTYRGVRYILVAKMGEQIVLPAEVLRTAPFMGSPA